MSEKILKNNKMNDFQKITFFLISRAPLLLLLLLVGCLIASSCCRLCAAKMSDTSWGRGYMPFGGAVMASACTKVIRLQVVSQVFFVVFCFSAAVAPSAYHQNLIIAAVSALLLLMLLPTFHRNTPKWRCSTNEPTAPWCVRRCCYCTRGRRRLWKGWWWGKGTHSSVCCLFFSPHPSNAVAARTNLIGLHVLRL